MAIISTMIGGVCGFLTFLSALFFFDFGVWSALALYIGVGIGLTATLIVTCLFWQALVSFFTSQTARATCPVQNTAHSGFHRRN